MFSFPVWPCKHGKAARQRRVHPQARLSIEMLEDRLALSTTTTSAFQTWSQQTFKIDDQVVNVNPSQIAVSTQTTQPTNASYGSMIGLPSAFSNYSYRGTGYSVAVIDTGIDYTNPNLGGGFGAGYRVVAGYNFVNNTANPMDDNGHGTFVASEIASSSTSYSGIAPDVNLVALKVLDANGAGTFGNVLNALDWVVANRTKYNIVAINLSLGAGNYTVNPYTFLDADLSSLKANGVFISVAAGNSYYDVGSQQGLDFPAIDPYVVSVGAVYDGNFGSVAWADGARDYYTAQDVIASFSQRSSALSIMAPGALVTNTGLHNTLEQMAGTSMAAPVITGAAVLLRQALDAKHLTANEDTILSIMKSTGVTVKDGDDENNNVVASGLSFKRINVSAALDAVGNTPTTPPSNPTSPPVMQPISNQTVAPGGTLTITLSATDPNGLPLTYSAIVLNAGSAQAYQLKQQLGLTYLGNYYTNAFGQNEKFMGSTSGTWYCILPNGQLRRWAGSMAVTLQATNLIATLDPSYYADPSLLWNAQPSNAAAPTVSVSGNQLTIQAPASASGNFQIQVTANDGKLSASQTFTLAVQKVTTPPQIGVVPTQSMLSNRSDTVTLSASDSQNNAVPMTYTAKIVGTFATAPASLAVSGSQLTIYSSPSFVGGFDVQVTGTANSQTATTTFHVNVAASSVAASIQGDFNGDGVKDTASFNQDGSWWVSLNKADGSFVNQNWGQWSASSNWSFIAAGDFNGDGKTDVVGFNTGGSWWVGQSTGTNFKQTLWTQWSPASNWAVVQVGDFNHDGKTDIIGFNNGGSWWVGQSTGSSFTTVLWTQWSAASSWSSVQVFDVNGDGIPDIVGFNKSINKWFVGYSTGRSFNVQLWTSATPPSNPASTSVAADAWFNALGEWTPLKNLNTKF